MVLGFCVFDFPFPPSGADADRRRKHFPSHQPGSGQFPLAADYKRWLSFVFGAT